MMNSRPIGLSILCVACALIVGAAFTTPLAMGQQGANAQQDNQALTVQYLEIVTPAVDETCEALAKVHAIEFGDPVQMLGNARTAQLDNGGRIGVRAPMRATETPIVRPYVLVDDIEAAVKAAKEAGAEIALPPIELPGEGTFSIYILGGIEHGLWQL